MALAPGTRLGPYEVQSALGSGGMGEVYRARDTRLDRSVAIKVLAPHVATDPNLRDRFEREARAVAALDHPHICSIYDVGAADGIHFLVMPHLEGQTLAARLERGALPLTQALTIAGEIADALDKAHRQGVVHRDLKPANIMLTKTGSKLLDFGLAKLRPPGGPISMSGMVQMATTSPGTAEGAILGTVHYMAPEQVEGREVDARADIWALGVVLYEMLTGARPFSGDTPASVIGSILKDTPTSISTRVPLAPPGLDRLVAMSLEKDPDLRWQSAHDVAAMLRAMHSAAPSPMATSTQRSWLRAAVSVVAGIVLGAIGMWLLWRPPDVVSDRPVLQHATRLTHDLGFSEWPTWSPDSKLFAYSSNRDGNFEIYVRRVDASEDVNVTRHEGDDVQPALSPDGTSIAFVSTRASRTRLIKVGTYLSFDTRTHGGDVWVAPTLGGQARRLAVDGNIPQWHPDGGRVAYVTGSENRRAILEVPVDGHPPTPVLAEASSRWEIIRIRYAPSGRWMTFETADREVFVLPSHGGEPVQLLNGTNHAWDSAALRFYYVNQQSGGGSRIELAELEERRDMLVLKQTTVVSVSTAALKELSMAADGQHLLAVGVEESVNLSRVPLTPDGGSAAGPEEVLSTGLLRDRYPSVSPDSTRVTVGSNRLGRAGLWLLDLPARRWQRVVLPWTESDWINQACWAPTGQHVVVVRFHFDNTNSFWHVALDGSSTQQLLEPAPAVTGAFSCAFSPTGHEFVYARRSGEFNQLFVFNMSSRTSRQFTSSASHKREASWSPDGEWIAFSATVGGATHAVRLAVRGGTEETLTTGPERHTHLFYSPDGRWLYVQPSHRNIWRMPAGGGALQQVTRFNESGLFLEEPAIAPDGRWIYYNKGGGSGSIWMLTLGREGREVVSE